MRRGEKVPSDLDRPDGNLRENVDWLKEAYHERGLTQKEIADIVGCCQHHVSVVLRDNDIQTKSKSDYNNAGVYVKTWSKGYERIYSGTDRCYHHRLLAVAEYGFNNVKNMDIHHKNDVSWDNRPENISVLKPEEHMSMHSKIEERDERGRIV